MITAIDSSVLLSVFKDETSASMCLDLMERAARAGELVICDIVAAEVGALFGSFAEFQGTWMKLGIRYDAIEGKTAHYAGTMFRRYRNEGGPRDYLIPDFLIGAHAFHQADQLIARDRGYLRRYFKSLKVVEP